MNDMNQTNNPAEANDIKDDNLDGTKTVNDSVDEADDVTDMDAEDELDEEDNDDDEPVKED